jgi:hypothetical protein
MHEPSWQIACDENGIDANEDFHFPFIAGYQSTLESPA